MNNATRWIVVGTLVTLWLANEALPVVFGVGEKAAWDWAFTYVTMRGIVLPSSAAMYIGGSLFTAVRARRFDAQGLVRSGIAAAVVFFCWVYQYSLFMPR
jgi:hypothetical protein